MIGWFLRRGPGTQTLIGFLTLIGVGSALLMLPISTPHGRTLSVTDAVFTATSAVCVTGLIVVPTPTAFTGFGEAVILLLIQFGGLGIILSSSLILLGLQRTPSIENRLELQKTFAYRPFGQIRRVMVEVFGVFLLAECAGAAILTVRFWESRPIDQALWHGLFHSVSAICNARFSLNPDSLIGYRQDPVVLATVGTLVVAGGMGFVVLAELVELRRHRVRLTLHTRTMLIGTVVLIVAGALGLLIVEPSLGPTDALFQSVTARTAGFNTVELAVWRTPTALIMIALMFVGAGPASTAGGVKLTTACTVLSDLWSRMRGYVHAHWLGRRLPTSLISDSILLFAAALTCGGGVTFLLSITEQASLRMIVFEAFSALGTVGLSLGLTEQLTTAGKWIIIGAMFLGRLGPLSFVYLLIREKIELYTYPEERMLIG